MGVQLHRRDVLGLGLAATLVLPRQARASTTLVVTSNADSGAGSLRHAILRSNDLNAAAGKVTIQFNLPVGQRTIRPTSLLPTVTRKVAIDARTQPGWRGYPMIELDGSLIGPGLAHTGLTISANVCTVAGLVINRSGGAGLALIGSGHTVLNCYFGTDITGSIAQPNGAHGCSLYLCSDSVIGGATAEDRCIASGNSLYGITISGGPTATRNRIIGCYVGLKRNGVEALPNTRSGLLVYNSPSNTIGGYQPGEGNIISGGTRFGLNIDGRATPGKDASLLRQGPLS